MAGAGGPHGSGRTTLVNAIADRLQLSGTSCVSAEWAALASGPPDGVVIVERGTAVDTAKSVLALVRAGWRVLATADGPSAAVDAAFAALTRSGKARLVELPALERPVREHIVSDALPGVDAAVVNLLARAGPGDGVALAVLAARTIARGALGGADVDLDAAAMALRRGQGVRTDGPPVPARLDELLASGPTAPASVLRSIVSCVTPLVVAGPLTPAIAEVQAGAPMAIAGGRSLAIAHRAVLHHALAGRSVLLLTACETGRQAAAQLAEVIKGRPGGQGRRRIDRRWPADRGARRRGAHAARPAVAAPSRPPLRRLRSRGRGRRGAQPRRARLRVVHRPTVGRRRRSWCRAAERRVGHR